MTEKLNEFNILLCPHLENLKILATKLINVLCFVPELYLKILVLFKCNKHR